MVASSGCTNPARLPVPSFHGWRFCATVACSTSISERACERVTPGFNRAHRAVVELAIQSKLGQRDPERHDRAMSFVTVPPSSSAASLGNASPGAVTPTIVYSTPRG
jgi:hypothetical protein